MPLNCGIVGLPNVGKSTIFNALTSAKAQAANYPFCTIDPNTGVVTVPDARLAKIAALIVPQSLVPTSRSHEARISLTMKEKGYGMVF